MGVASTSSSGSGSMTVVLAAGQLGERLHDEWLDLLMWPTSAAGRQCRCGGGGAGLGRGLGGDGAEMGNEKKAVDEMVP
jgi:hypothetical protein